MPPKARITQEMIIDAAYEITREEGAENVNVRSIARRLGCSTQPVMYCFDTVEEIRRAVYQKADEYHSAFLMNMGDGNPMLEIGLNYIRFAAREQHLFQLLFQSNHFAGKNLMELIQKPGFEAVAVLAQCAGVSMEQAERIMKQLFLFVHGYACMLASNSMVYDEAEIARDLTGVFEGILAVQTREEKNDGKTV